MYPAAQNAPPLPPAALGAREKQKTIPRNKWINPKPDKQTPNIYINKTTQPKTGLEMPPVNLFLRFVFFVVPGALPAVMHRNPKLLQNIRTTLKTGLEITRNCVMIPRPSWEAFNTHYAAFEQETVLSPPVSMVIHHACSGSNVTGAWLCSGRCFWLQVSC